MAKFLDFTCMDEQRPLPIPEPDSENPLPIVLAKDDVVVLSYTSYVARTNVHVIVTFRPAFEHRFGKPSAQPKPCAPYEVAAGKAKNFVFTFKDAVFECLATDYASETLEEDDDAVRLMSRRLYK